MAAEASRKIEPDPIAPSVARRSEDVERIDLVGRKIGSEAERVVKLIDSAIGAAVSYNRNLAGAGQELGNAKDPQALRAIVDSLARATSQVELQNRDLQSRLEGARHEIAELQANLATIRTESLTDSLTKLANRKHFDGALERAIADSGHGGKSLSLLICDVDHFKRFNDTFGHVMGDQVLRLLGATMLKAVRGQDLPARYGGEEFAIILPDTSLQQATAVAENIRKAVSEKELVNRATGARLGRLSISVGIAEFRAGDRSESLIARADQCLYSAKQQGRNRVIVESAAAIAGRPA